MGKIKAQVAGLLFLFSGLELPAETAPEAPLPETQPPEAVAEVTEAAAKEDAERMAEEERARALEFCTAVALRDTDTFCRMLNEGMDPDVEVPVPAPEELVARFEDPRLKYYLTSEPGFTALMLATATGNTVAVRILLTAGAKPNKMTRRHKTFALWLAGVYRHTEITRLLLGIGPESEVRLYRISVDLASQWATLYRANVPLITTAISSGRKSHPTPPGEYVVTNKYRTWKSTIYRASMPYFLRLSCGDFGFHAGVLPGRPASHGCIRLPPDKAKEFFEQAPVGTLVRIE